MNAGGKGHSAGILVGETILEINGSSIKDLVHVAAQKLIKNTGFNLTLTLDRSTGKADIAPTHAQAPPPKVPLVTKSQFQPLPSAAPSTNHKPASHPVSHPVSQSHPKPFSSSKAYSTPTPPTPPSPLEFPAPPPELCAAKIVPDIVDRPSVLAPKSQIAKTANSFPKAAPVFPNSAPVFPNAPNQTSSNAPKTNPAKVNSVKDVKADPMPASPLQLKFDTNELEDQLSDMKLANDPAGRKRNNMDI